MIMKNKFTAEHIIKELGIKEEIIAIYSYGSQVYVTATEYSDHDYVIVAKSTLESGAFKNNAVSNKDYTIQGTLYSRAGFTDAINNYEMPAMECMSLDTEQVLLKKWPFKINSWNEKDMIKKVIQKASASRHIADKQAKTGYKDRAARGMFHALRILHFGIQLKENKRIVNFSECNQLHADMMRFDDEDFEGAEFDTRDYYELFDELSTKLKG